MSCLRFGTERYVCLLGPDLYFPVPVSPLNLDPVSPTTLVYLERDPYIAADIPLWRPWTSVLLREGFS